MPRFLLLFLLTGPVALGQAVDSAQGPSLPAKSNFKVSMITEIGVMGALTSTPNMQAFFRQNNIKRDFPIPLDPFVYLNFGPRYKRLKLMIQAGYGFNYFPPNERDALVVRRTYAGFAGAMLGYDVLNDRNRRLYLNVGVGGVNYDYAVLNRTSQSVAFQNLPQYSQAGNIPSLKFNNAYWDVNLELSQREKRKLSVASVFRLGYRRGWQPNAWQSGTVQLRDAPLDRLSQVYFQAGFQLSRNYAKATK
ncbi:hypothetical protein [Hymenobacter coccineus]|uniref:Outer membrane protein beta-barrel domain-containing protein n=1 Tax=Hymenobacter coccineus TaxID=1908235 RepID=A0A1G1SVY0_9BACT|nr:hypothetical protein [Hymenobacter coccineus]OGX82761.1 hypothetical protein BEN49_02525 [Hymenobacter coccineus]